MIHDDPSYFDLLVKKMRRRGVKITDFPTGQGITDAQTLVPFLLLNDHSILLVRNPKKEVVKILQQIVRTGTA